MRPFKRKRKGKLEAKYSFKVLVAGQWIPVPGFTDLGATKQLMSHTVRAISRSEAGMPAIDTTVPPLFAPRIRQVLLRSGMLESAEEWQGVPLADHLAAFRKSMEAGRSSRNHVAQACGRLFFALAEMRATLPAHLSVSRAESFLASLRDDGRATRTRDHYARLLKQFSSWAFSRGRLAEDVFSQLATIPAKTCKAEATRVRRVLSVDQVRQIISSCRQRGAQNYLATHPQASAATLLELRFKGNARAMAVMLGYFAGLRSAEAGSLLWGDLDLSRDGGSVTVRAANAKSDKARTVPLPTAVVDELTDWLSATAAHLGREVNAIDRVCPVAKRFRVQYRLDVKRSGIEWYDGETYADFHALRHSYATALGRANTHPSTLQYLMGHASIAQSMAYCHRPEDQDASAAVAALPTLTDHATTCATKEALQDDTECGGIRGGAAQNSGRKSNGHSHMSPVTKHLGPRP